MTTRINNRVASRTLLGTACLLALLGLAVILHGEEPAVGARASFIPSAPLCDPNWTVSQSPNLGASNELYGIAALSANDVWAVGYHRVTDTVLQTLVERWDGTSWTIVPSPNLGTGTNVLNGVATVSANDVWAVGYFENSDNTVLQTLVEHWDGLSWTIVYSPYPNSTNAPLQGVAAVSANDVWAVGHYFTGSDTAQTLVEHWDGFLWSIVPSPNVGTNDGLNGVAALSANDVWAVGYSLIGSAFQSLVEHWDGSAWAVVSSPHAGNDYGLKGVAAVSAGDVWAVGYHLIGTADRALMEHWDGTSWTIISSPTVGMYEYLNGVAAVSANDVWAVGEYYASVAVQLTLIEHWDGTAWNVMASPNPSTSTSVLYGVAAVSASDVWAVGYSHTGTLDRAVVEHYNPCPPPTPTPTSTACPIQFSDVPNPSTFYAYIRCLACRGIVSGYADGTFRPNNNVTRGQLSKVVSNAAGFSDPQPNQMFEDVPLGSTFQLFVGRLASRGYINGYPCGGAGEPCNPPGNLPYFRPNNNATRGQIAKIDSNAAGYSDPPGGRQFEDVAAGSTYYTYTYRLATRNVMGGYQCGGAGEPCNPPGNLPYFRPNNNATRGQTSKIVANTFFAGCVTPSR